MPKLESVDPFKNRIEAKGNPRSKQEVAAVAAEQCLHHLFEAQVETRPQAVAVTFDGHEISYTALNQRSNRIAHTLLSIGVQPQQHVAMLSDPGPLQVESLFGILKAGAAFVCLDSAHPSERLTKILEETKPVALITDNAGLSKHAALLPKLKEHHIALLLVDRDVLDDYDASCYGLQFLRGRPESNPEVNVAPGDPAYIVYTSGSTGDPKGIVQSHRSFSQFIEWQSRQFEIVAPQRWAQWASIGYDASYCEIFGTLCFGATLCMAENRIRHDPARLVEWARTERVTILQFVPSFCRQVIEVLESETNTDGAHPLPDLRYLLLAGEPLPVDMAANWLQAFPNPPKLFNLYGPSESVLATYYQVQNVSESQRSIPIGRAIDGREILILDEVLEPCSEGVRGEIYIRSNYLAMGYFQRPEETAEKFMQNPLHNDYSDPVYRTGDLGRRLPDGNIEFGGRTDNLVKIRGFRVELEEIEAVLNQHEDVRDAVVVAPQNPDRIQQIIAYVIPRQRKNIDKNELRRRLKSSLPEYMVPAGFVVLEQFPLNANSKVDRKKLASFEWETIAERHVFQAPVNEIQLKLVRMWEGLLDLKHIGIHDNFFAIGGHSLLAVKLFDLIRREFGKSLLPDTLIAAPTIEELADEISKAGWNPKHQGVVELQPYGDRPPFFCVPGALGGVMYMSDLAHCLKKRPFYGLRPQDLHFEQPPKLSIEDIATTLLQDMRAIQPNGPYYLGGHSFGCAVAFEMACQLQRAGEKIGKLIFFDYVACEIPLRPNRSLRGKVRDGMIEVLFRTGLLGLLRNFVRGKASNFWHNLFDIPLINVLAEKYHRPDRFRGRITSFRAMGDEYDSQLGLLKLAESGVDVEYVPGDHNTLFTAPNVEILAEKLEQCLHPPHSGLEKAN